MREKATLSDYYNFIFKKANEQIQKESLQEDYDACLNLFDEMDKNQESDSPEYMYIVGEMNAYLG